MPKQIIVIFHMKHGVTFVNGTFALRESGKEWNLISYSKYEGILLFFFLLR